MGCIAFCLWDKEKKKRTKKEKKNQQQQVQCWVYKSIVACSYLKGKKKKKRIYLLQCNFYYSIKTDICMSLHLGLSKHFTKILM